MSAIATAGVSAGVIDAATAGVLDGRSDTVPGGVLMGAGATAVAAITTAVACVVGLAVGSGTELATVSPGVINSIGASPAVPKTCSRNWYAPSAIWVVSQVASCPPGTALAPAASIANQLAVGLGSYAKLTS